MNLIEEVISKMIKDIDNKKEKVIKNKLLIELGVELDYKIEKSKRFKSLQLENLDGKETYYYNDGSANGFRVVTFEIVDTPADFNDVPKIGLELKYY